MALIVQKTDDSPEGMWYCRHTLRLKIGYHVARPNSEVTPETTLSLALLSRVFTHCSDLLGAQGRCSPIVMLKTTAWAWESPDHRSSQRRMFWDSKPSL